MNRFVALLPSWLLPAMALIIAQTANHSPAADFDLRCAQATLRQDTPASARRFQRPMIKNVLVLNFNPIVPNSGGLTLSQFMGWNDPHQLSQQYVDAVETASNGTVCYNIAKWEEINDIPTKEDGHDYTVEKYIQNRLTDTGWQPSETADYYKIFQDYAVARFMNRGYDELWMFGDHYFGFWEAAMAGPGSYFINGGVYPDVVVRKPFAIMGFSYERGLPEMLHNLGHRAENHLLRAFGNSWNMADPEDAWDLFTANVTGSPDAFTFGVGNVHFPFNGTSDYDYGNSTYVDSYAYEFENYPRINLNQTIRLNSSEWGDLGISYEQWWLDRLPANFGVDSDGRQNNWWRYIVDFQRYEFATGLLTQ